MNDLQSSTIASISHDLRTPLSGIISTLLSIDISKVNKEFYDNYILPCINNSEYLLFLVNDILTSQ